MKKLTLIRHGKASQDYNFKDFDRPLLPSGIENTLVIANNYLPTIIHNATVWSSASRRTSETAIAFTQVCNIDVSLINFRVDLYTFESRELERIILTCYNEIENLIIFGHNSAITDFVNKFGDIYIDNVPTSGLVVLQFETNDWQTISNGKTIKTLFPNQF